jgi:hypothetical protein
VNIYISCALTHVPREMFLQYAAFIHSLAHALHADGIQDLTYALINSDPQLAEKPFAERARLCYLWDRELVEQADLIIAEASFPSTGMGIELQIAEAKGTPIILCFHRGNKYQISAAEYRNPDNTEHILQIGEGYVSLMALGLPTVFKVIGYQNEEEAIKNIMEAVRLFKKADQ